MGITKTWVKVILVGIFGLLMVTEPYTARAAGTTTEQIVVELPALDRLEFQSSNDYRYISLREIQAVAGDKVNLSLRLLDESDAPFSGTVTGYIADPNGNAIYYPVNGSQGNYSVSNVIMDEPGEYNLVLWDNEGNTESGTIVVLGAKAHLTGELALDQNGTIAVEVKDSNGQALARETITVDGTEVGGNVSNYTTLYNGTFSFRMTPTQNGTVKLVLGGHIIGYLEVKPAYTQESRIGQGTNGNSSLSVEVAKAGWKSAPYIILTRDELVADAMTAIPLSKEYDAPILMTSPTVLNSTVRDEILNLNARNVFIIGGVGAISEEIEQELRNYGLAIERIAGGDRYETAVRISEKIGEAGTVYLASGYGEPDALAASSFAARQGSPILLTGKEALPAVTQDRLAELNPSRIVLLGATGVISSQLEEELKHQYSVERWGGADRYETEQIIFKNLFTQTSPAYFTSALVTQADRKGNPPYADALLSSALAAKNNGVVVILPPDATVASQAFSLSNAPYSYMLVNRQKFSSGTVVGNYEAVSLELERQLKQFLNH